MEHDIGVVFRKKFDGDHMGTFFVMNPTSLLQGLDFKLLGTGEGPKGSEALKLSTSHPEPTIQTPEHRPVSLIPAPILDSINFCSFALSPSLSVSVSPSFDHPLCIMI